MTAPTSASPTTGPTVSAEPGSIVVPFATGYSDLTFVTNAGDGSNALFVVEQKGRIYRLAPGASAPGDVFLDITDRVSCCGERGLLGLAFPPDYESSGRFFVDYTDPHGDSVISRFAVAADGTADPTSEAVLLTQNQPFSNHNGGMLAFNKFGNLYIGFGDGGSGGDPLGNGQDLGTFLGKILRISPEETGYSLPLDNPTVDPARGEIWDWGLRNPWRFSFDRESGALFIGDVGQDSWEELDVEAADDEGGHNYGWNVMEGTHCYAKDSCDKTGLTLPVLDYPHSDGCTIIGGYVYRGSAHPDMAGRYVYADLCSQDVWAIDADTAVAGGPVTPEKLGHLLFTPSSFGEDESGELYVVDLSGSFYSLVGRS